MSRSLDLKVTSHVGRDLLASAASFKTDYAVVWEYVVNSLQYVDDGVLPRVVVSINSKEKLIIIADNGRGMNDADLSRFFTMHGENIDRVHGRRGRGKFGTGKAAAFGIANELEVDTRSNGKRNVVYLDRNSIDKSDGTDIKLDWRVRNEVTGLPNGTVITISGIHIPKIGNLDIIEYIERHLVAFRGRLPEVAVNEHVCKYQEPIVSSEFKFHPDSDQAAILGNVELTVKVSPGPLVEVECGICVTAGDGNLVAIETAGIERKELGNYLFGEIDVPALEDGKYKIEPYDSSRSLQLNPLHPVCRALIPFIGSCLEKVRLEQVKKLREARQSEQSRRLAQQAQEIADILNDDFHSLLTKLKSIRSSVAIGKSAAQFGGAAPAGEGAESAIEGLTELGDITNLSKAPNLQADQKSTGGEVPNIPKEATRNPDGAAGVDSVDTGIGRARPRGGFSVEYKNLGSEKDRSMYDASALQILINLDHIVIKSAMRTGGVEDVSFRRLSYEISFSEYAIALGNEMANRDPDIPADDLLYEVKRTLNRVASRAANLYL